MIRMLNIEIDDAVEYALYDLNNNKEGFNKLLLNMIIDAYKKKNNIILSNEETYNMINKKITDEMQTISERQVESIWK